MDELGLQPGWAVLLLLLNVFANCSASNEMNRGRGFRNMWRGSILETSNPS